MVLKSKTEEMLIRFHNEIDAYYISKRDLPEVGSMISGAFASDPSLKYLLGDVDKNVYFKYCRTVYQAMLGDAVMIASDADINNLVVLCPPGYKGIPTIRFLLSGGTGVAFNIGFNAIRRSIVFESNSVSVRNRFSDYRTWYLMTFAVREGRMHQGLGSAILRPVLEWMDKNHYSLYLETHKAVNVEMYEHFGFRLMDTGMVPKSRIKQYGMLRPAK